MKKVSIAIDDYLYAFYMKVGENTGGIKPEQVMADALFKLAGELSLKAINKKSQDRLHLKSPLTPISGAPRGSPPLAVRNFLQHNSRKT